MSEYTLFLKGNEAILYGNVVKENIESLVFNDLTSEADIRKSQILVDMTEAIKKRIPFKVDIQDTGHRAQVAVFRRLLLHKLAESDIFLGMNGVFYQEKKKECNTETEFNQDEELILLLLNDGYIIQKKDGNIIVKGKE